MQWTSGTQVVKKEKNHNKNHMDKKMDIYIFFHVFLGAWASQQQGQVGNTQFF